MMMMLMMGSRMRMQRIFHSRASLGRGSGSSAPSGTGTRPLCITLPSSRKITVANSAHYAIFLRASSTITTTNDYYNTTTTITRSMGDSPKEVTKEATHPDKDHQQQQQQQQQQETFVSFSNNDSTDSSPAATSAADVPPPDPDIQNFVAKLKAIHPKSVYDDAAVEQVLEESWELLQERLQGKNSNNNNNHPSVITPLLQSMQQLLDLWFELHIQNPTMPTQTNRPFVILLRAWTTVSFQTPLFQPATTTTATAGSNACEVLKRWYELLGGDLALAPTVDEFNQVLAAYAATSTNLLRAQSSSSTTTPQSSSLLKQVADEAWSVVQELKQWGYTMEPTLQTNAHLIRCLANSTITMTTGKDQYSSEDGDRLEQVMTEAIMPVADKYRTRISSSKATLFETRPVEDPTEVLYLVQTCCDALLAAKHVASNRNNNNHHHHHHYRKNSMNPSPWGSFLSDQVLRQSQRITNVLDYGQDHPLPYACCPSNSNIITTNTTTTAQQEDNSDLLPAVFTLLVEGCQAWQALLQHGSAQYTPSGQQQQSTRATKTTAHQISDILEQLEELGRRRYSGSANNRHDEVYYALLKSYLIAVKAWERAISGLTHDSEKEKNTAKMMLDNVLKRLQDQHYDFIAANEKDRKRCTDSWNTLLSAKFCVGHVDEVYELWKEMRNRQLLGDSRSYSIVLKALANSSNPNAAEMAHRIWKKMIAAYHRRSSKNTFLQLNGRHYASVIVAWSRSPRPNAAQRAMEVFQQLEQDFQSELASANQSDTAEAAEHIDDNDDDDNNISSSLKPSPVHYSALLTTLTRSLAHNSNATNDSDTIHHVMLNLIDRMLAMPESYRNNVAFGTALAALAKIGTQEAALVAQRILDDMEQRWRRDHFDDFKPNATSYGHCMLAWSKAAEKGQVKDADIQVAGLLRRLESDYIESGSDPSLLPNETAYCALLNAVLASGKADVAQRAEEILRDMEEKARSGLAAPPNDFVYSKVIAAHKASAEYDSGEKAEAILERMAKAYYEEGITAAKPTDYAYNGVIQAWSRSQRPDKAVHAKRLLDKMQNAFEEGDIELQPNRGSYVAVLQCCAHTPVDADPVHRQEAVRIALETILDLDTKDYGKSTSRMYPLAVRTACEHTQDKLERKRVVATLFQRCCEDGLVGPPVLATLRRYYPEFHSKLPGGGKDIKALPAHWTRNFS